MMKEIIDKAKNENGNEHFTQKDMTWFLIAQNQEIINKIDKKADKRLVYTLFGSVMLVLIFLLGLIKIGG